MATRNTPRSGVVTAAAVVAILGSLLILLVALLGLAGVFLMQNMPENAAIQQPEIRAAGFIGVALIAGCGVWGLVSGIGLLSYRNWARISTLAWSGLSVVICGFALLFVSAMKIPMPPGSAEGAEGFARVFVVLLYVLPILVGIWWLILFTRKPIAALFTSSPISSGDSLDPSGFPAALPKPGMPLPISVLGWFFIVSGILVPLFYLLQPPAAVLFGHLFRGPAAAAFLYFNCAICLVGGIGLLKLRPWSFWLIICSQAFWLLSGTVSLLSPNYETLMRESMASSRFAHGQQPPFFSNLHLFGILILFMVMIPLVTLLYYRTHFLRAPADTTSTAI